MKTSIEEKVLKELSGLESKVICISDLKTRGSYASKTKALSELSKRGEAERIINGIYFVLGSGISHDDIDIMDVVLAVARKNSWRVVLTSEKDSEDGTKDIFVRSTGPTKSYKWDKYRLRFVNESAKTLPSPFYHINYIVSQLRDFGEGKVPGDFAKQARKSLAKEEYREGLSTLSVTYGWVKKELNHILKKKPKKFRKTYIQDNIVCRSAKKKEDEE